MLNFVLILAALPVYIDAKLSCKNLEGEDVDWFVALKRPEAVDNSKGTSFVYFDSTKSGWVESEKRITSDASAIGATVSQLYSKDKVSRISHVSINFLAK
ncbi:hypothetical protein Y032_0473g2102 [Ancylostoma ceylanicum]|uniref:Uncharacterized protein n=1 Tax=Ancylostoma ceylanicum TaxID=53326 RepID=A0A016WYJ3_9BILA|nr:hypothetical protein Y032_0473g2102 [Ancylostoma ceylanicum]